MSSRAKPGPKGDLYATAAGAALRAGPPSVERARSKVLAHGSSAIAGQCLAPNGAWRLSILPLVVVLAVSCRHTAASAGSGVVEPARLTEQDRASYDRLQAAQSSDPAGAELDAIAREILATPGDEDLRITALVALAGNAWLRGADTTVISSATEALALLDVDVKENEVGRSLARLLAFAHARSGDPGLALELLGALDVKAQIGTLELRGASAAAWDRADNAAQALRAYALWRELLPDGSVSAEYCEHRIRALWPTVPRNELAPLLKGVRASVGVDCLTRVLDQTSPMEGPAWLAGCSPPRTRIGVALPRSGSLAGLADPQLAAVTTAAAVLGPQVAFDLLFEDSGSTPEQANQAVLTLRRRGASVVVGPVGAANIAAAAKVGLMLQIPGEGAKGTQASAASLESRVDALIDHARFAGRSDLVVLLPINAYGERVRAAAIAKTSKQGLRISFATYDPTTTSFAPVLATVEGAWKDAKSQGQVALLIGDTMQRVDLIARQLRRSGKSLDGNALLVLSTAEGFSQGDVGAGHEAVDGLVLAPVAAASDEDAAFVRAYVAREGKHPGDQALLVWQALARALGVKKGPLVPALLRVKGGGVVTVAP